MGVVALKEKLATRLGVDPDRVATGCGSVALLEHLARAACAEGDEIVYAWRSFEAYPIVAATTGATSVRVPNRPDHGHDLDAMAGRDQPRAPGWSWSATPTTRPELTVRQVRVGPLPRRRRGRTFSWCWTRRTRSSSPTPMSRTASRSTVTGRTSWCCARCPRRGAWPACGSATWSDQPDVVRAVGKVITPFSTSAVAQAAALAALDADDEMRRRADLIVTERERVLSRLRKISRMCPRPSPTSSGCPLAGAVDRVRRGLRGGRRDRAPVRRRRGPGHHRNARGERHVPRRRRVRSLTLDPPRSAR